MINEPVGASFIFKSLELGADVASVSLLPNPSIKLTATATVLPTSACIRVYVGLVAQVIGTSPLIH